MISDELNSALERLGANAASGRDIELVKRAIEAGSLALHREQVSVGGSVQGSIVIGDRNIVVTLTPEVFRLLTQQKFNPSPLPPKDNPPPEPTRLPPGSRLPFPINPTFTGRQDDLQALADDLLYSPSKTPAAIVQPAALSGSGGIGKTQLAVEFCYRYGQYFYGIHRRDGRPDGRLDQHHQVAHARRPAQIRCPQPLRAAPAPLRF